MSVESSSNEGLAHRWHKDLIEAGQSDVAAQILTPDCVVHLPGRELLGVEGAQQLAAAVGTAFPDRQIEHLDAVAAGDTVAIRWVFRGTHQGDWQGVPPTGKAISYHGIDMYRVRDSRLAEVWIELDRMGVLEQMDALPA